MQDQQKEHHDMTASLAAHAAPRSRSRSRTLVVAVALLAGWLGIAGVALAAFMRTADGQFTVTTTGPSSTSLTLYQAVPTFTDVGQTKPVTFVIANTLAGQDGVYTKYRLNGPATVDPSSPCASAFSFTGPAAALPGGNGVTLRNIATGSDKALTLNSGPAYNGTNGSQSGDVRTALFNDPNTGQQFTLTLDANAPQACANQASVPINLSIELIP